MTRIPRHAQPDTAPTHPFEPKIMQTGTVNDDICACGDVRHAHPVFVESPWGKMRVDENKPFVRQMVEIGRRPYAEQVPAVAQTAEKMLPYLTFLSNKGWPGLTPRDADDMGNLRADLEAAFARMVR